MSVRREVIGVIAVVAVAITALGVGFSGRRGSGASSVRSISFRGEIIATVNEAFIDPPRGASQRLVRTTELLGVGESTTLTVDLDDLGQAQAARYERTGQRVVELLQGGDFTVDGRLAGHLEAPVVVLDVLHRVRLTTPTRVTLFEPASAESMRATLVRRGPHIVVLDGELPGAATAEAAPRDTVAPGDAVIARALPEGPRFGPGAFAEGDEPPVRPWAPVEVPVPGLTSVKGLWLDRGPVAPPVAAGPVASDRSPGPFIESDAAEVGAFARPLCRVDALETARAVGEAVRTRVDAGVRGPAPGALAMLRHGGDCDGAAALAAAALRACGHAARVVVGYRLVDPGPSARLVPHALAEVYPDGRDGDGARVWWRLDPTVPVLTDVDDRFLAVAPGLGGALSMGRILGVVDAGDVRQETDARP